MLCPRCGNIVNFGAENICHTCGFDTSKAPTKEPSDLRETIDSALHQHGHNELISHSADKTRKTIFEKTVPLWWLMALISFILEILMRQMFPGLAKDQVLLMDSFAESFGGMIGALILPLLIFGAIVLIGKLRGKKFERRFVMKTCFIAWAIFVVLSWFGRIPLLSQNSNGAHYYKYDPANSEYNVTFAQKPKLSAIKFPNGDEILHGEQASLTQNNGGFQRAEFIQLPSTTIKKMNKEYIYNYLKTYADYNGISYPEIEYNEGPLGRVSSMRGYKELRGSSGEPIKVTYTTVTYYGSHSLMMLYAGAPSKIYPTNEISNFYKSVRKN